AVWHKRPHRLSGIGVMMDGAPPDHELSVLLGGGTWANGEAASDHPFYRVRTATLRAAGAIARFHRVQTQSFPLVSSLPPDGWARGTHTIELPYASFTPALTPDLDVIPWINGFWITAG